MQESEINKITLFSLDVFKTKINTLNLDDLIDYSYNIKKTKPSELKSNYGGYQSPGDLIENPDFFPLIDILNNVVSNITKTPNYKVESMWLNISSFGNYNGLHTHSKSFSNLLSGVFYLKTPKNAGNIMFHNPIDINHSLEFTPEEGDLLIFPRILAHAVSPNLSQEDRISIAFNYK